MPNATLPGWPHAPSPFHEGARAIQERLGLAERLDRQGRKAIRAFMPEQHRAFFAQLPFLVVGAHDREGQPWASLLVGSPGFATSPDPMHLRVAARPLFADPLAEAFAEGAAIGLLGIELPTRRRNRLNGRIAARDGAGFAVAVTQSFGNCPQYIQSRAARFVVDPRDPPAPRPVARGDGLDAAARRMIEAADTLFIATAYPADGKEGAYQGVEVSHRGGRAGFVRVEEDGSLLVPDFVGNFHFKTLGNILLEKRAGLLFIDFESGDLLYLAAEGEIIWEGELVRAFAGAERLLRLRVAQAIRVEASSPLRFSAPEYSPFLARTGSWDEAGRALEAARERNAWRRFRIARAVAESADVRSLYLEAADGGGLAPHEPGQFLPIRVSLPGEAAPALRTYTLSAAANGRFYRLSVKRDGPASRLLHEAPVGSEIEALAPRGDFTFDAASRRPAVLISAGIGVTPLLAMLDAVLVNDGRTRVEQRLLFIHGARNSREHPFARELRRKAALHGNLALHVAYSAPLPEDRLGASHDSAGRIDRALLERLLPGADCDVYLCGPPAFMQDVYDALRDLGVPDAQIRSEAFGPAALRRTTPEVPAGEGTGQRVTFARSGKTLRWSADRPSLLALAEAAGLSPPYSCRSGICGTCATRLLAGAVDYRQEPMAPIAADEALICCAVPRPSEDGEGEVLLDL